MKKRYASFEGSLVCLLTLTYINQSNSQKFITADDTNLLYINKSIKKIIRHVNHDLKLLCHWLRANKLSLNADKSEIVIFRSKSNKITKQLNFRISGQKINPTTHLKYLGIYLDEYLNWEFHTNQIILKLPRANCMLSKIRHYVPQKILLSIYYSIFSSHMTYGCQVWSQEDNPLTKRIQNLQNKAIKLIFFKTHDCDTSSIYKNNKVLKFSDQIQLTNILFIYDYLNKNLPDAFVNAFSLAHNRHNHQTRNTTKLILNLPQVNTTKYGLNSITYKSIKNWNEILSKNPSLQNIQSKYKLKNIIKILLLDGY